MAIDPLSKRLDQMVNSSRPLDQTSQEAASTLVEPVGEFESVQVAGLGSLGSVLKEAIKGGKAVRGKKQMDMLDAMKAEPEQPPAAATVVEPAAPAAPAAPKPAAPKQAAPKPAVKMPKAALEPPSPAKLEADAAAAAGTGKPPEVPFNLDLYDDQSVAQYTEAVLKNANIDYQRITFAEIEDRVAREGMGPEYTAQIRAIADRYGELPFEVRRASLAFPLHVRELNTVTEALLKNPGNKDLQRKFLEQWAVTVHVGQAAKDIQVAPAQALAILNQSRTSISATDMGSIKALLDDPSIDENIRQAAVGINTLIDNSAKAKLIEKLSRVGFVKDLWLSTWVNGLLSWTATPVVNMISNSSFALLQPITRFTAGAIGGARQILPGANPDRVFMGEAFAGFAGYVQSSKDAMRLGWEAFKTGKTLDERLGAAAATKLETRGGAAGLDAAEYGFEGKLAAGLSLWSKFVSVPGRVIQSQDEAFKALAYKFEVNAQAYRDAVRYENQLLTDGVDEATASSMATQRIIDNMNNPFDYIDAAGEDFAKMLTFTRDLDGFAAKVQEVSNVNVLTKTTMPFVRTPTWLTSEGLQHSWFAPLSSQWRKDMAAGGAQRDLALAKFGLGSTAMVAMTSLAVDGRITGGGPGNSELRKVYMRDGWRPYSFVLNEGEWDDEFKKYLDGIPNMDPSIGKNGKLYISMRGFDPIAAPFAMAADYVEYARYEDDQDMIAQVGLGGLFGLYQYIGQSPFMQTLGGMVSTLGNSVPNAKQVMKDVVNQINANVAGYVIGGSPVGAWSSFQAGIERYIDGSRKDITAPPDMPTGVKGWYEGYLRWRSRTPGLSGSLPDRLNRWAEVEPELDPARPWLGFTGIRTSESKMQEVDRMLISLGMPLGMPPRTISQTNNQGVGASIKLDTNEYNELLRIYAQDVQMNGMTVQQALVARAKEPDFARLDKYYQQQTIKLLDDKFMEQARQTLLQNSLYSDAIQERLEIEQERKQLRGSYKQ